MIGERAVFLSGDRDEALPSTSLKDVPPRRQRQEQHSPGNDAAQRPLLRHFAARHFLNCKPKLRA